MDVQRSSGKFNKSSGRFRSVQEIVKSKRCIQESGGKSRPPAANSRFHRDRGAKKKIIKKTSKNHHPMFDDCSQFLRNVSAKTAYFEKSSKKTTKHHQKIITRFSADFQKFCRNSCRGGWDLVLPMESLHFS